MNEKPILFSGAMVRAILAKTKTQTRRVIKPQPTLWRGDILEWQRSKSSTIHTVADGLLADCPHGIPGDRLWVRETHFVAGTGKIFYRADGHDTESAYSWRPSIFMLRQSCRITLEITGVRAERLHDISEADALAEGVETDVHDQALVARKYGTKNEWFQVWSSELRNYENYENIAIASYRSLWDSINGKKYPWASNPWVWVVEFKQVTQ